jgi:DNA-binding HxlR family transcriptional regulator
MAKNILAARLRKLVEHGILEMQPASDGSAYQEYRLTEKGRSLGPVVEALRKWGESHLSGAAGISPGPAGPADKIRAAKRRGKG